MKSITKIVATLLLVILMMVNFKVEYNLTPIELQIGVEMNAAEAKLYEEDMKLVEEICWSTGERIDICRHHPPFLCIISEQNAC
jgi:hypothetical protein